ncbi:MAG: protein kinase [Candidatus Eisenbacteria bacterium]|uniref:Protein kinase n=1 Tax=Eiseniibacteriota bacterium TaxID=2212470 RepID=A0A849SND8_UNCEI|nr:protein kinase [Candidatus Eisenbacteria bacterium]
MIGNRISHYRIVAPLGTGRLGAVYRARDERSGREVALRVLPDGLLRDDHERRAFRHDALQMIRVHHSRLADVLDFVSEDGVDAVVTEFVPGETLAVALKRGRLHERIATRVAHDVAEGLAAGHERGVVHRYLNPHNIVLTGDGGARILDFGLPRFVDEAGARRHASPDRELQVPADRLAYAAPEQVLGTRGDARSDLYSLGVILYEMLTGERPHHSPDAASLATQIATMPAPQPSRFNRQVSRDLEYVVLTCLEKEPNRRYLSALDLATELKRFEPRDGRTELERTMRRVDRFWAGVSVAGVVAFTLVFALALNLGRSRDRLVHVLLTGESAPVLPGDVRTVAVLPLRALSPDDGRVLSLGLADALSHGLTCFDNLRVISSISTRAYPSEPDSLQDIARELHAEAIVTGTVQQVDGDLRVHLIARLGASGLVIWEQRASAPLAEFESLINRMLKSLVQSLRADVLPNESIRFESGARVAPEAIPSWLRARRLLVRGRSEDLQRARELLDESLSADTTFRSAWDALGEVEIRAALMSSGHLDPGACARLRKVALRSFKLEPQRAEAQLAWGWVRWRCDGEVADAERFFELALDQQPANPLIRLSYARLLGEQDRFPERFVQTRRAIELDPRSAAARLELARCHHYLHQFARAERALERTLTLDSTFADAHAMRARVLVAAGAIGPALAEAHLADSLGASPQRWIRLRSEMGTPQFERTARAVRTLIELGEVESFDAALCLFEISDRHRGFSWLARGVANQQITIEDLRMAPELDAVRGDERFAALLERVGSVESR